MQEYNGNPGNLARWQSSGNAASVEYTGIPGIPGILEYLSER